MNPRDPGPGAARVASLAALLAAAGGLAALGTPTLSLIDNNPVYAAGENWIYALLPAFDNFWFPFVPTALAAAAYLLPVLKAALPLLPLLLVFSAAAALHSARAGAAAAWLAAVFGALVSAGGTLPYSHYSEQAVIASCLLALVCALAAPRDWPWRRAVIGLALSMSVYAKGVTAPLVPAVLFYEARLAGGRRPLLGQWPALLLLAAALGGWSLLNWTCLGRPLLLEPPERSGCNISTGAAGLVATVEGDWRGMLGIPPEAGVTAWAVRRVARHPLTFLASIPKRAAYVLFQKPLVPGLAILALLGLAAAVGLRRRRGVLPLSAAAGYMFAVHLLMPVEGRYFIPAWFLCCALGGMLLADLPRGERAAGDLKAALPPFLAAFVPLALLWTWSFGLLLTYPTRAASKKDAVALALARPGSPLLNGSAGAALAASGELSAAAEFYRRSWVAEGSSRRKADYLRVLYLAGGVSGEGLLAEYRDIRDVEAVLLAGLKLAEEGKPKAGLTASCGLQLCVKYSFGLRHVSGAAEAAMLERLRREGADYCAYAASSLLERLPPGRAAAARAGLARPYGGLPDGKKLYSLYSEGRNGDYVCGPGGCSPNENWPGPADCAGLLPPLVR